MKITAVIIMWIITIFYCRLYFLPPRNPNIDTFGLTTIAIFLTLSIAVTIWAVRTNKND